MSLGPQIITCVIGPMANNCYLLIDPQRGEAAVIDPGFGAMEVLQQLPKEVRVQKILLTHGHFDHMAGIDELHDATGAPVGVHPADRDLVDQAPAFASLFGIPMAAPTAPLFDIVPGEELLVGDIRLDVRHTPGHSPGGVCFAIPGRAFVGDCIFAGSIGRTDLPGSDHFQLIQSIRQQLLTLGDDTVLLSGHGPETTAGRERLTNPFLVGAGGG